MSAPSGKAWIDRLQRWAESEPNVRLALLVGSQARAERPADALSDIDLVLFARDPDRLLTDDGWVARLGPYWTSHLEPNALESGPERRVLFVDGQDVDIAVFPEGSVSALTGDVRAAAILRRGFRILVDKASLDLSVPRDGPPASPPTFSAYSNLVNDYWFHLVWAAKKIRRGEWLAALEATNGHLRVLLVVAVRWHSIVCGPAGQDVWHGSRFFEAWADPRVLREFPVTVAAYEPREIARALRANRTLFCWLSDALEERLSFPSPLRDRSGLSNYLDRLLGDLAK